MKPRGTQKSRTIKFSSVHHSTDPQSDVARARSWAAIYVQDFDAPCVLQFAWISALCCALHRSTSLVIHRSGSYNITTMICLSFEPAPFFSLGKKKTARFQKGNVPINSRTSGFVGFLESGFGEGAAGRVVTPSTGGAPFSKKKTPRPFVRSRGRVSSSLAVDDDSNTHTHTGRTSLNRRLLKKALVPESVKCEERRRRL